MQVHSSSQNADEYEVTIDVYNSISAYHSPIGFYVRATIRGHHSRKFHPSLLIRDCEYLYGPPHPVHGKRITCFEVDLVSNLRSSTRCDTGALRLRCFMETLERFGIQLPEREDGTAAVSLSTVLQRIDLVRA